MNFANTLRQHTAALRALLVLTLILGIAYPVFIWLLAQLPGLKDKADGSLIELNGAPVGSSLIGQLYTDADVSGLKFRRCIVMTSIDAGVLRGDLAERLLPVHLERIDSTGRRTEAEILERFDAQHGHLLGALLDLLRQAQWQSLLQKSPGYQPQLSGRVRSMNQVFPWWRFRGRKTLG